MLLLLCLLPAVSADLGYGGLYELDTRRGGRADARIGQDLLPPLPPYPPLRLEQEDELEGLRAALPGEPGDDYPIFASVPETGFSCRDRVHGGYYSDIAAGCQVFHVCVEDDFGGRAYSFLCPNGTLFRQELQICEWWFNVDCGRSEEFYPGAPPPVELQEDLGNLGGLFVEEELPPPEPLLTTLEDLLDPSFARSESRPEEQRQSRNRGGRNRGGRSRNGSSRGGRGRKGSRSSSRQNRRKARQGRRQPRQQPQPYYWEYGNYDEYGRFYPYTEDHSVDYYY